MNALDKINKFMDNEQDDSDGFLIDRITDFIDVTDPDMFSEEQKDILYDIIDEIDYPDEEDGGDGEISEQSKLRKKISPGERRKRARAYRQNKSKIKRAQKKYKRSAQGKKTARLAKKMAKRGKTSTGKRQVTYT